MLRFPRHADEQAGTLVNIESLLRDILTELRGQRVVDHADRLDRFKRSASECLVSD